MKKIFTLLLILGLTFSISAQFIYNDFDGNQNVSFNGWPNAPTLIANPDPSGVNTSANAAEWIRSGEQWAHIYAELDGKIDFTTGETFYLKVWSPIACQVLFKLEDKNNSGIFTEVPYDLTVVNEWVQLEFDFTGATSGIYDKVVIFLDFATFVNNTYYIDDIAGPEYSGGTPPKPLLAIDVQDNFENDGWATIESWSFQDPELATLNITTDPLNGSNHVADYARSGSFEWTNAQTVLGHRMDLSSRNIFSVDVYFPSENAYGDDLTSTAAVKLQNSLLGANAWMTQTEIKLEVSTYNEWITLDFDFSAIADSIDYDQIVVQFGGEGHFVPAQFYFDNFELLNPTGVEDLSVKVMEVYPNPASNNISISGVKNVTSVNIYSIGGQLVCTAGKLESKIDISHMQQGLYIISITTGDGEVINARFVKK